MEFFSVLVFNPIKQFHELYEYPLHQSTRYADDSPTISVEIFSPLTNIET